MQAVRVGGDGELGWREGAGGGAVAGAAAAEGHFRRVGGAGFDEGKGRGGGGHCGGCWGGECCVVVVVVVVVAARHAETRGAVGEIFQDECVAHGGGCGAGDGWIFVRRVGWSVRLSIKRDW